MRPHEHTQPAQSETMAQRVRVARPIWQALCLAAGVRNLKDLLPRRVRHRKARLGQPDHRWFKAIIAFDKHPAPLIGVQTVKRDHLFIAAVLVPVDHLTVLRDRHLDHDSRHIAVPALLLRPPNRSGPAPFPVRSDRCQRLARYPVVPPLPFSDSFSKACRRVTRGLGTGQFPDQQRRSLAQPQTARPQRLSERQIPAGVAATPRLVIAVVAAVARQTHVAPLPVRGRREPLHPHRAPVRRSKRRRLDRAATDHAALLLPFIEAAACSQLAGELSAADSPRVALIPPPPVLEIEQVSLGSVAPVHALRRQKRHVQPQVVRVSGLGTETQPLRRDAIEVEQNIKVGRSVRTKQEWLAGTNTKCPLAILQVREKSLRRPPGSPGGASLEQPPLCCHTRTFHSNRIPLSSHAPRTYSPNGAACRTLGRSRCRSSAPLPSVSMHGMPRKGCQTGAGGCIVTQLPTDWSCP